MLSTSVYMRNQYNEIKVIQNDGKQEKGTGIP